MSHGESISFKNDLLNHDLELITSDTYTSDEVHDNKGERQFSSILFGSELMTWLERAPKRSTILVFLDTCHAGSAASVSTTLTSALQKQFGLEYLVIGSSLSQDKAYSALFIKEIMGLWAQDGCLNQDTLPNDVYNKMKAEAALQNSEGMPEYIIRYAGPLCLGNFGKDRRLLFMYAGQGAEENPFQYTISEDSGLIKKIIKENQQLQYTFLTVPLDAKKYIVAVRRGNQFVGRWPVDLSSSEHQTIWFDTPSDPRDIGKIGETMVAEADKNGSSPAEIADLAGSTAGVYRSIGLNHDADRVLALWGQKELAPTVGPVSNDNGKVYSLWNEQAKDNQTRGNFGAAAMQLENAARQESNPEEQKKAAKSAYIAALAAGDFHRAESIHKEFDLDPIDQLLKGKVTYAGAGKYSAKSLRTSGLAATLDYEHLNASAMAANAKKDDASPKDP